jgi:hypothetical protein
MAAAMALRARLNQNVLMIMELVFALELSSFRVRAIFAMEIIIMEIARAPMALSARAPLIAVI